MAAASARWLGRAVIGSTALLAGCVAGAPAPGQQPQAARPACHAGADAKGIATGFFSLFTDDLNGCL